MFLNKKIILCSAAREGKDMIKKYIIEFGNETKEVEVETNNYNENYSFKENENIYKNIVNKKLYNRARK